MKKKKNSKKSFITKRERKRADIIKRVINQNRDESDARTRG